MGEPTMASIGAREANRSFSKILKEAENGKSITITRNGKPVALQEPMRIPARVEAMTKEERKKKHQELMDLLEKGFDLGGKGFTRDEMHER
jgi:antitoxin (DNA-binding transcriptional repressor) of toxin-antitoxin stability system